MNYDRKQVAIEEDEKIKEQADTIAGNHSNAITHSLSDKDIFFAKERFKLHEAMPDEGVSIQVLKNYIFRKYGI